MVLRAGLWSLALASTSAACNGAGGSLETLASSPVSACGAGGRGWAASIAAGEPLQCPPETVLVGATPPVGTSAWCERVDGTRHGPFAEFFPLGGVRTQAEYREGRLAGVWQEYYEGGQLREERHYADGESVGRWGTWYPNGARQSEHDYASPQERSVLAFDVDGAPTHAVTEVFDPSGPRWTEKDTWDTGKASRTDAFGGLVIRRVGVSPCDEYATKFSRCIRDHVPEAAQGSMRDALEASVRGWHEAARGIRREQIAEDCRAALDAAQQATSDMGCRW